MSDAGFGVTFKNERGDCSGHGLNKCVVNLHICHEHPEANEQTKDNEMISNWRFREGIPRLFIAGKSLHQAFHCGEYSNIQVHGEMRRQAVARELSDGLAR